MEKLMNFLRKFNEKSPLLFKLVTLVMCFLPNYLLFVPTFGAVLSETTGLWVFPWLLLCAGTAGLFYLFYTKIVVKL